MLAAPHPPGRHRFLGGIFHAAGLSAIRTSLPLPSSSPTQSNRTAGTSPSYVPVPDIDHAGLAAYCPLKSFSPARTATFSRFSCGGMGQLYNGE